MRHPDHHPLTSSTRRQFLAAAGAATALPAWAQGRRAITLVVPPPPAGPVDRVARLVALHLSPLLGAAVVVENRAGAAGQVGVKSALRAARDAQTLIAVSPSIVCVNPARDPQLGFDPLSDLEPLGIASHSSGVVAVRQSLPLSNMQELVAYARAQPYALSYASFGHGTSLHLHSETLAQTLGIKLRHVPYRGEAPALMALARGEVDLMLYVTAPVEHFVRSGRVRALASTSRQRWSHLPDVPSFSECGVRELKGYEHHSWVGFALPSGAPPSAVQALKRQLASVLQKPALRDALARQGLTVGNGDAAAMRHTMIDELGRNRRLLALGRLKLS